jgi:hypothetical protein
MTATATPFLTSDGQEARVIEAELAPAIVQHLRLEQSQQAEGKPPQNEVDSLSCQSLGAREFSSIR